MTVDIGFHSERRNYSNRMVLQNSRSEGKVKPSLVRVQIIHKPKE